MLPGCMSPYESLESVAAAQGIYNIGYYAYPAGLISGYTIGSDGMAVEKDFIYTLTAEHGYEIYEVKPKQGDDE